jgi:hypothetical protein
MRELVLKGIDIVHDIVYNRDIVRNKQAERNT